MQTKFNFFKVITLGFILGAIFYAHTGKAQSFPNIEANHLVLPETSSTISFTWQGDSIHSKWEPYAAMLIPVKLKNCHKLFYMQFDLGSPSSMFYKNKLKAIHLKYPKTALVIETDNKLNNYSFKANKMTIFAKEIAVKQFDSSTINWNDKNSIEIIGTIGADLIDGKVVIIDYPQKKLILSQDIPAVLKSNLTLTDFIYVRRSILLPATILGSKKMLYFDTGSSMYELLTDKKTCESLAIPNTSLLQSNVQSWGKILTANSLATNESVEISEQKIPIRYATYVEGVSNSQIQQMMKMGIGGMTGNKLFLNVKLILDTKNKKFGVISSP
jgi:hypothetical protein